jgi:hypothetical protein
MPTIASSNIPTPKSWIEFEDITLSAARSRWNTPDFFRNGRPGQQQNGVDIFGTVEGTRHVGIQCKNTLGDLSLKVILREVENANSFSPTLAVLYVATTAARDGRLQAEVRELSNQRKASGYFAVELLFWDDVAGDLAKDQDEFFKHYPQFGRGSSAPLSIGPADQPIFSIEEMRVTRDPAFGGNSVSMHGLRSFGFIVAGTGFIGLLFAILRSNANFWVQPIAMVTFIFGMSAIVLSKVLKTRRFEHFLLGRYYLEASISDRLYLTQLSATCPWCGWPMRLRNIGPKDESRDDVFICARNPRQHRVLLDPTHLPTIED